MSMRLDLWISMANYLYWLVVYLPGPTPLKNMKVSWDDEIPNIWKIKKMFQTTNQTYIFRFTVASMG
jgi:hypothetical protein